MNRKRLPASASPEVPEAFYVGDPAPVHRQDEPRSGLPPGVDWTASTPNIRTYPLSAQPMYGIDVQTPGKP